MKRFVPIVKTPFVSNEDFFVETLFIHETFCPDILCIMAFCEDILYKMVRVKVRFVSKRCAYMKRFVP